MSLSAAAAVDSKTETTTESGPISVHLQNTEKGAAEDVFGDEDDHDIRYKTLSWPVCGDTYSSPCGLPNMRFY